MAVFVNTYVEDFPPLRFIGKRYTDADRVGGTFAAQWHDWLTNGGFDPLNCLVAPGLETGYIGLEIVPVNRNYWDYWIGCFTPAGTPVPPGYSSLDLPASRVGIAWIKGHENDGLYCKYDDAVTAVVEAGLGHPRLTENNELITFERYNYGRYTQADETGAVILDRGVYLN